MATITDLTNTTWLIPTDWTASEGYGQFEVEGAVDSVSFTELRIGWTYYEGDTPYATIENSIVAAGDTVSIFTPETSFTISFTGGTDVTNTSLISWLENNGELQGADEEETETVATTPIQGKWQFNETLSIDADLSQIVNFTSTTIFEDGSSRVLTCSALYVVMTTDDATGHMDYTIESVEPDDGGTYPKTTEVYMDSAIGWGTALVSGTVQIIVDFGSAQEVSEAFYTWFTANAVKVKNPVAAVSYKGSTLVSLFGGEAVTLSTLGTQLEDDIRIEAYTDGDGSDCSGNHIIEVDTLPTEDVDETALYLCEDKYYKYVNEVNDLVYYVSGGSTFSYKEFLTEYGITIYFHLVPTIPTEGILESTDTVFHMYYIVDINYASIYQDSQWQDPIPITGVVSDVSELSDTTGYFIVGRIGFVEYLIPTGELSITENGRYDVSAMKSVLVSMQGITIVETAADLPTDMPAGSIAIVLREVSK